MEQYLGEIIVGIMLALIALSMGLWGRGIRTLVEEQTKAVNAMRKDMHQYMLSNEQRVTRAEEQIKTLFRLDQNNHGNHGKQAEG